MDDVVVNVTWPEPAPIARFVAERYAVGAVMAIRPLRIYTNAVFDVMTDGGRYAVKLYRPGWRTGTEIR